MTVREAEFSRTDVDVLLASRRLVNAPRGSHGVLLSEATDLSKRGDWVFEPITDFVREGMKAAQAEWKREHGDKIDPDVLLWTVKRKA